MAKISISQMEQFPMLVIGSAVLDFKKACSDPIVQVTDTQSLREVVAYYSSIAVLDRLLIIEDLSFLPKGAEVTLLKFVEETSLKLVLLSYYDVVSPILLSRCKVVVKYQKEPTESAFLSPADGSKKIDELVVENTSYYDRVRYMGKYSPKVYFLEKMLGTARNRDKILSMIE